MKKASKAKPSIGAMRTPSGYTELVGTRAPIWQPKAVSEFIEGTVIDDKIVKSKKGRKSISSRLLTLASETGTNAVWVSAALEQILGAEKSVKGRTFMIVYEGLRKIKGQGNPMKVFRVFEKKGNGKK